MEPGRQFRSVLYHGTRAENVEKIRETGLQPPSTVNPHMWPMVTTSKEQAFRYAPEGDKAVIEYRIPRSKAKEHLSAPHQHDVYGFKAQAHGVLKPLPGQWITAVHRPPIERKKRP